MAPPESPSDDTRPCPLCGETIKQVAIRCKHCHGDLTAAPAADFDRAASPVALTTLPKESSKPRISDEEFEQRFLEFAHKTTEPMTAISVAYALKVPIAFADDRLESLAASDLLNREIDDEGNTYFVLPGRKRASALAHRSEQAALQRRRQSEPPSEAAATAGLVLNLCMPGIGSIVAGKPRAGVAQLALLLVGLPLCFAYIGFPMIFGAWIWGLVTSGNALHEARLSEVPLVGAAPPRPQLTAQGSPEGTPDRNT